LAPHLTLQQRQRARALRREGKTIREIAVEIGCSRRTVKRVMHGPGKRESRQIGEVLAAGWVIASPLRTMRDFPAQDTADARLRPPARQCDEPCR